MKKCEIGIVCEGKNDGFIIVKTIEGKRKFICGDCLYYIKEEKLLNKQVSDEGFNGKHVSESDKKDKKKEWKEGVRDLLNEYCV